MLDHTGSFREAKRLNCPKHNKQPNSYTTTAKFTGERLQDRTESVKTEQVRSGQDSTGQYRTGQDRT